MLEYIAIMVIGGLLVLIGMIVNEVMREYSIHRGKTQLPETIEPLDENIKKTKNRRKDDYA
jgi:hypothetical protein